MTPMKVKITYSPAGGRWGWGFNYWCPLCGMWLGNSVDSDVLTHSTYDKKTTGIWPFRKTVITTRYCPNAGKTYRIPEHAIEVEETN